MVLPRKGCVMYETSALAPHIVGMWISEIMGINAFPLKYFLRTYCELRIEPTVESARMKRDSNCGHVGMEYTIWSERLTCKPTSLIEGDQK